MEGVWAQITEVAPEKARIRSAADALLSFWREVGAGKTITNIRPGYALLVTENGYRTADAVPVWRVETADGTEYSYDAR